MNILNQLHEYVTTCRNKGFDDRAIAKNLEKHGHSKKNINAALAWKRPHHVNKKRTILLVLFSILILASAIIFFSQRPTKIEKHLESFSPEFLQEFPSYIVGEIVGWSRIEESDDYAIEISFEGDKGEFRLLNTPGNSYTPNGKSTFLEINAEDKLLEDLYDIPGSIPLLNMEGYTEENIRTLIIGHEDVLLTLYPTESGDVIRDEAGRPVVGLIVISKPYWDGKTAADMKQEIGIIS